MQTDKTCADDKSVGSTDWLEVPDGYWDRLVLWLRSAPKVECGKPDDVEPLV